MPTAGCAVSREPLITLRGVSARSAPLSRSTLSIAWGEGVHAIVGTVADGGPLLLGLLAGRERVRAGELRVLGHAPDDAAVRPQVALVPARLRCPKRCGSTRSSRWPPPSG